MFIIKMYVYKMTCMIQYPCSKYVSSPSLPPPPSSVGIHIPLTHSQCTILGQLWCWGVGFRVFIPTVVRTRLVYKDVSNSIKLAVHGLITDAQIHIMSTLVKLYSISRMMWRNGVFYVRRGWHACAVFISHEKMREVTQTRMKCWRVL